jgi:hypothetical protein
MTGEAGFSIAFFSYPLLNYKWFVSVLIWPRLVDLLQKKTVIESPSVKPNL